MTIALRHQCRKCRTKLAEPTDNPRRAFCCRGCFGSFYRSRCVVCEEPIRRKTEWQKTCISRECKAEVRRFPATYSWPERPEKSKTGDLPSDASRPPRSAHLKGVKSALRGVSEKPSPPFRCLREWRWEADADYDEHRLYNRDGKLAARLWGVGDHWYLLHAKTTPIQSAADLETAKRLAISMALAALPLDPTAAAKVARDNSKPNPMGPPLNPAAHAGPACCPARDRRSPSRIADPGRMTLRYPHSCGGQPNPKPRGRLHDNRRPRA
jgi:hypothetical protein